MNSANVGLNAIYNGGLTSGLSMAGGRRMMYRRAGGSKSRRMVRGGSKHRKHGTGFFDMIKKAHSFVKDNQLVSKAKSIADTLGATAYLDEKTGGNFSKVADLAASKGYGRRRRRGAGRRRVVRRAGGSKVRRRRY